MKVAVVGTGYVGLVTGAGFSEFGNDVVCVDIDAGKIARLNNGEVPIFEPGLDELIQRNAKAGRLAFTTELKSAVENAQIVFIAVGTPPATDGSADLSAVFAVAKAIGQHANGFKVVVTKSTVPVGTADKITQLLAEFGPDNFGVASNPEFLKEGAAIEDFMKPDRVVIGSHSKKAIELLRSLYSPFVRTNDRILITDPRSSELSKYAANAMLATRISFMNDLSQLCEKIGADIEMVRRGVGSDPRIGPKFLYAGPGFGGSCFPKDLRALLATGENVGHELEVVRAAERVNARQKRVLVTKAERLFGGSLKGKAIGVWGLSFKPQTDDIRESPALSFIDAALEQGAKLVVHDPQAMPHVREVYGERLVYAEDMYSVAEKADLLVLFTEWHEYRRPDFARLKARMASPNLLDGRNIWDSAELRALGFRSEGIGRPQA